MKKETRQTEVIMALLYHYINNRAKKMSNVRSVNADEAIRLAPPVKRSLEELIAYMGIDEKMEVSEEGRKSNRVSLSNLSSYHTQ